MNLSRPLTVAAAALFRFSLALRRLLPRRKCHSFGSDDARKRPGIDAIYVINLDREPGRWSRMTHELRHVLDSSGFPLLSLTERHVAVDARDFLEEPQQDDEIDPHYTLADQLFVEPQPLAIPTRLDLNTPVRMSRAEIAIARSHIAVWRRLAASDHKFALILEDDAWFHPRFAHRMDQAWEDLTAGPGATRGFDVFYVSYVEVKHGAPKTVLSRNIFRPVRGLWYLSGYVLSREGAQKLLGLLPCRGPVDLWINHQFAKLDVRGVTRPIVSQRRDVRSTNSYSILPTLTTIGAINSEAAALFNARPPPPIVFAFGPDGSGQSSLAVALSMLGYRCCSDLQTLPTSELDRLLDGRDDRVFNAYVNIGALDSHVGELKSRYPDAKFILTGLKAALSEGATVAVPDALTGADIAVLSSNEPDRWRVLCEHVRCAPPACVYPALPDLGQRPVLTIQNAVSTIRQSKIPRRDSSPWIVEPRTWWQGIRPVPTERTQELAGRLVRIADSFECLDPERWLLGSDTFTDNLALFRPSNVDFSANSGAALSVKVEPLGVRDYSAASLCSRSHFLFGRFEASIRPSNAPGVVTGFFLHRNSPRQEIDIEIAGNRPDRLLVNVFYNPGGEGAPFDYGYRGTPTHVELGFDSSKASHRFAIEWSPCEIAWFVDDQLVHKRAVWDPTPIPDLPMRLYVNSWLSRSTQLAGRRNNRRLPATTTVRSLTVEATSVPFL